MNSLAAERRGKAVLTAVLSVICVIYVLPVVAVLINSFKLNTFVKTDTFALPTGEMWAGMDNFIKGMTFGNYPFPINRPPWPRGTSPGWTPPSAKRCTSCACSPWWSPSRW